MTFQLAIQSASTMVSALMILVFAIAGGLEPIAISVSAFIDFL